MYENKHIENLHDVIIWLYSIVCIISIIVQGMHYDKLIKKKNLDKINEFYQLATYESNIITKSFSWIILFLLAISGNIILTIGLVAVNIQRKSLFDECKKVFEEK